jgi:hypothetical protein
MHTALVSRLLRDKNLWEETTLGEQEMRPAPVATRTPARQFI